MKTLSLTLLLCFVFTALFTTQAGTIPDKKDVVITNLINGINSDNDGLRISSATVLGELIDEKFFEGKDASRATIPLLKMLGGKTEEERITAALSLYKIGNGVSIYRLRGSARFDESEKVRKVSKNLYYTFHEQNGTSYFYDF